MDRPAFLDKLRSRTLTETAVESFGSTMPPHISIRANKFRLVDAAGQEKVMGDTLDVVVIDLNPKMTRVYYGKDYEEDDPTPPLCFSDNGVAPSSQARTPQAPACAGCKWSTWGSAVSKITGKGIPACAQAVKLAVLALKDESRIAYLFRIPPNSIAPFREYAKICKGHKVEFTEIVTTLSFSDEQVGTINFKPSKYVDDEALVAHILKLWEANATDGLVGKLDKPYTGPVAAPQQAALPPAVSRETGTLPPPPKPVEQAFPETPAAEKKRGRPAKKAENSGSSAPQQDDALDIPPFLQRPAATSFMEQAPEPPDAIMAELDKAFALDTK